MADVLFRGMRGTGDWIDHAVPESWREMILMLDPNGEVPLTGILSMMGAEQINSHTHHWFQRKYPAQNASITAGNVFTAAAMEAGDATAATTAYAEDSMLYIKMALNDMKKFLVGDTIQFVDSDQPTVQTHAEVVSVTANGASSQVAVKLIDAVSVAATYNVSTADVIEIIGAAQAEGAGIPSSITYDPTEFSNYTQISEQSLDLTRTALLTNMRTGDPYEDAKMMALLLLAKKREFTRIFGYPRNDVYDTITGKPKRYAGGLEHFINTYSPDNVFDYVNDSDFSGKTWLQAGKRWLDNAVEQITRVGGDERLCLVGSGALQGIAELAEAYGDYSYEPGVGKGYGIKVNTLYTPNGTLHLKKHPLFQNNERNRYRMMAIVPENIKERYITDITFKPDENYMKGSATSVDGRMDSWIVEETAEIHHTDTFGDFHGVGKDNAV